MALALARGALFGLGRALRESHVLYYISVELDRERLQRNFSQTGWFGEHERDRDPLFHDWETNPQSLFCLISARVDLSRPVPSSEELVNALLVQLRERHINRHPNTSAIVIVDSLTALLRDCDNRGEERRQTHEFIRRLEVALGRDNLGLTIFLAEESSHGGKSVNVEDYVVDFVIRLALDETAGGRRLRSFEVVKSHGAFMRLGVHTWAIVTKGGIASVIASKSLRDGIGALALGQTNLSELISTAEGTRGDYEGPEAPLWATALLFVAGALQDIGKLQEPQLRQRPEAKVIATGIPGLDQMLRFKEREGSGRMYWMCRELGFDSTRAGELSYCNPKGLAKGSATVIVGQAGAGKTNMCLQFLAAERGSEAQSLFVNFEVPAWELIGRFPHEPSRANLTRIQPIFRRRGNLDMAILLAEIRFIVKRHGIQRIAIDGLSSLLATTSEEDYAQLIERLLSTITDLSSMRKEAPISLFLTYEPTEMGGTLHTEIPRLSALADNVIVVRPVAIEDEVRQAVYVAKARGAKHDRTVREIRVRDGEEPVRIEPGLEAYSGLLTGQPAPVNLVLQLFHENAAEERYNHEMRERLRSALNYPVEIFGFSRTAISRSLRELSSTELRFPASHVRVLMLDEWMIQDLSAQPKREQVLLTLTPFDAKGAENASGLDSAPGGLITRSSDFWAWDVGKCRMRDARALAASPGVGSAGTDESGRASVPEGGPPSQELAALPLYADYGLFCVNARIAKELGLPQFEHLISRDKAHRHQQNLAGLKEACDTLPVFWAKADAFGWFAAPAAQHKETLVDWMKAAQEKGGYQGFACDLDIPETSTIMFLELCWAFGASEEVFHPRFAWPHSGGAWPRPARSA